MIEESLLIKYQAELKEYLKDDILFKYNTIARNYFQIRSGEVKVCNTNSDGKEFIQSIFSKNRGVGEPALFGEFKYPANAIVTQTSQIWVLKKKYFLKLLSQNAEVHFEISKTISQRLHYKSIIASEISIENPSHRILTLLNYLKHYIYDIQEPFEHHVDLSRQQIADLTGLRVETTIRAIKKLEKNNYLKLINHKIYI